MKRKRIRKLLVSKRRVSLVKAAKALREDYGGYEHGYFQGLAAGYDDVISLLDRRESDTQQ